MEESFKKVKNESVISYKGKHIIFQKILCSLKRIEAILIVFVIIQGISLFIVSNILESWKYALFSMVGTLLELFLLIMVMNYLIRLVEALMEMDEDIELLRQK